MASKTYLPEGATPPSSQIGATLEALAATIAARRAAGEESYTFRLLTTTSDVVVKKVMEESGEVALAAKDADAALNLVRMVATHHEAMAPKLESQADAAVDHLRYEAADVVYHLLVVLERYGITLDEFAAELNNRMTDTERPRGGVQLLEDHVKRGK